MGNIQRTILYMKRNGLKDTVWAVAERKDKSGMDTWQRKVYRYPHPVKRQSLIGKRQEKPETFAEHEKACISLLVPAYHTKPEYFKDLCESVLGQTYRNWQLIIADASDDDRLQQLAEKYEDDRIVYQHLSMNEGISDNTNAAFEFATGELIGLLDHDDILAPEALKEVAKAFADDSACDMVYTDEDKISADLGRVFEPNMKPDFNLDLLLTNNYICHFTVMKRGLFDKLKLRHAYDGAQDYDLFLRAVLGIEWTRLEKQTAAQQEDGSLLPYGYFPADYMKKHIVHVPRILYHWRTDRGSTADNPDSKRYAYEAGKRALEDFYTQLDWDVTVSHTKHLGFYGTEYHPDILSVRSDIWGICGRRIAHGRVAAGPVLGGTRLFEGMNYHYSGYLHRASLPLDVDKAAGQLIRTREEYKAAGKNKLRKLRKLSEDHEKALRSVTETERRSGRLLYLPEFLINGN